MGKLISELALKDEEIEVVAACDVNNIDEELGGLLAVKDRNKIKISDVNYLQNVIDETKPDVAVDFTVDEFENLVKIKNAPAVISPNMATGVNILFKMAAILTEYLNDWDIEIIETHHNRKQDNFSGTSLKILDTICEALEVKKEDITKYGRTRGKELRERGAKSEIGIHCIRAGDIVGEHKILYAGSGEYIELKHTAINRNCFATGAIRAIKFIAKQKENKIFEMKDVLNL
jgi:4-hydroxy-tetrahydrodipicolinate reductase